MRSQSAMDYRVIQCAMATKSKMVKAYEKELPPTMVAWHNSRVTIKKVICLFLHKSWLPNLARWWLMVLGHYAQNRMILWSREHMSWKIKSVLSPIPQFLWTGYWIVTWDQHSKNHITLRKRFFHSWFVFLRQNCIFNII